MEKKQYAFKIQGIIFDSQLQDEKKIEQFLKEFLEQYDGTEWKYHAVPEVKEIKD